MHIFCKFYVSDKRKDQEILIFMYVADFFLCAVHKAGLDTVYRDVQMADFNCTRPST